MTKNYITICLLCLSSFVAFAGGYQLYSESSAEAVALAGAMVGRKGMSSAPWYNPAAIGDSDKISVSVGGSLLNLGIDYKTPQGYKDSMEDAWRPTGFMYSIVPLNKDLALTLSVNAPYGMVTHYKSGWLEDNIATYTSLRNCYITPNLVYKVNDQLKLAAGFNVVVGVARLAKVMNYKSGLPSPQMYNKLYMRAQGYGFGWTVSAHYQPHEDWGFGFHYQSRVSIRYEGDSDFSWCHGGSAPIYDNDKVHTTIYIPATAAVGVSNTSFDRWTLSADVLWTEWSNYDKMQIGFNKLPVSGKPGYSTSQRNWDNVFSYRLAAEYQLTDNLALRAGYMFDQSPANGDTNSPEMPDGDKNYFSVGAEYTSDNWSLDVGYAYVKFKKSKLGKDIKAYYGRGTFDTDCHILSAQLTYLF